ncbi:hypothetical protein TNIN_311641 [Trichonephila inaurata madagascariensis]|uniref:Uncharacterized protein n=1 Tax=Trichonephila inaurata madagascariensis TaxID=2747483 RepID=A0A8X6Y5G9_9ARAC|nr:hypothetical protein TNIN_311641 [Trichonephila inaurata madagascariensis]
MGGGEWTPKDLCPSLEGQLGITHRVVGAGHSFTGKRGLNPHQLVLDQRDIFVSISIPGYLCQLDYVIGLGLLFVEKQDFSMESSKNMVLHLICNADKTQAECLDLAVLNDRAVCLPERLKLRLSGSDFCCGKARGQGKG